MEKRILTIGLVLLFIFSSVVPITIGQDVKIPNNVQSSSRGNILYVGGSGPNNYTKIQDAIDNANNDDTVFVFSGVYHEFVEIPYNKSVNLVGENPASTIIDGPADYPSDIIVIIGADNVELSGFTIKSTKKIISSIPVCCLYIQGNNVDVHTNVITNGWYGIMIDSSLGVHIYENTFTDNIVGCYIFWSVLTEVSENNFIDNFNNAKFLNSMSTFWNSNYWDDAYLKNFKVILGWYEGMNYPIFIPCFNLDLNPAKVPYDI